MSKTDAMRAMREARYARLSAPRTTAPTPAAASTTAAPARQRPSSPTPSAAPAPAPAEETTAAGAGAGDALCGHRSMNGRSCTREAGHPQKNHRYG